MDLNRRLPHLDPSRFSMIPRAEIPRSTFVTTHSRKATFDAGYLVPIYVDEVLPGDVHQGAVTIFARLATPLFPVMDNITLETFFFFVPSRILWDNFVKMMGERVNPADSISYTIPVLNLTGGAAQGSLADHFGIPVAGPINPAATISVNALPFRAYNKIYNEWFRDQNLQDSLVENTGNGPDGTGSYALMRRNKKPDYFTSALPWPQKGGVSVSAPLAGLAPIKGIGFLNTGTPTAGAGVNADETDGAGLAAGLSWSAWYTATTANVVFKADATGINANPSIYADLSSATGATINALRLAFQTQRLLERDARAGTRYTEQLRAHWGVQPEDMRLQRPEYVGGGRTHVQTSAIPQTSATGLTGGSSPLGALGATSTLADQHTFSIHAKEHGYLIGLAHFTSEITYQQGLHRMWTRQTRYDFYLPAFAHLGEQAIRYDEIYLTGTLTDDDVFGYQERWAEYRHRQSQVTGLFRSTATGNIDEWHLAQEFTAQPTLSSTFIQDAPPLSRVLAAGATANGMQLLFDSVFKIKSTRAMPMYSIPGMIDRF